MSESSVPEFGQRSPSIRRKAQARYLDDPHVSGVGTYFSAQGEPEWTVDVQLNGQLRPIRLGECGKVKRSTATQVSKQLTARGVGKFAHDLTVGAVAKSFLADRQASWKGKTYQSNCSAIRRFGLILDLPISQLDRQTVSLWHQEIRCDRTLSVLSGLLTYARERALIPSTHNPCQGLRRKQRQFKAHFISEAEYQRLGEVLQSELMYRTTRAAATLLLALTGARRSEILELRWSQVCDKGIQLEDSKSGPRFIVLNPQARWILGRLAYTKPDQLVFLDGFGRPILEGALGYFWQCVRRKSGLPKRVRLHDLRHGFASAGLNFGEDISVIGELLGHRDPESTLAYAHLTSRTVKAECERSGHRLQAQLAGNPNESSEP